jgi:hypothetical protein
VTVIGAFVQARTAPRSLICWVTPSRGTLFPCVNPTPQIGEAEQTARTVVGDT